MEHGRNHCLVVFKKFQTAFLQKLFATVTVIIVVSFLFFFTDSDKHTVYPDMIVSINNTGVASIVSGSAIYYTKVAVGIIRGIDSWVNITRSALSHIRQYSKVCSRVISTLILEFYGIWVYVITCTAAILALVMLVVSRTRYQF